MLSALDSYLIRQQSFEADLLSPFYRWGNGLRKSIKELALGQSTNEWQCCDGDPSHSVFALSSLPICAYILRVTGGNWIRPWNDTARSHHELRRSPGFKEENNYHISLPTK